MSLFPKAPFDLSVLPIYVARVPAAPLMRAFPRNSVAAATLTVHLACSHGSIVEDFQAALAQFAEIANELKKQSSHMPPYKVTQNEFRRIQA
jgi:hypothetical protein